METADLINDLKNALANIKNQGGETVLISKLEVYLSEMEAIDSEEKSHAIQNTEREEKSHAIQNTERNEAIRKFEHEMDVWKIRAPLMFNSVIEAGQTALKSSSLINGGAAVSLLAFLGNLLTKDAPYGTTYPIQELSWAMLIFFIGVGFSGVATAARYFSQATYAENKESQGDFFRWVAIVFALLSFGAFFYGGVEAYCALQPLPLAAPSA
jgi:hypothetical protein